MATRFLTCLLVVFVSLAPAPAAASSTVYSGLAHSLCFARDCSLTDQVGSWVTTEENGPPCTVGAGYEINDDSETCEYLSLDEEVGGEMTMAFWIRWDANVANNYNQLLHMRNNDEDYVEFFTYHSVSNARLRMGIHSVELSSGYGTLWPWGS